jgi:thiamine pyrophosphokinase
VFVVRSSCTIEAAAGDLLTLLPAHGPAHGVRTEGLLYALAGETLHPGSTRGVSNRFVAPVASVHVDEGVLLAIIPGERTMP